MTPIRRLPLQLSAQGREDQKPRIIRVLADGQEQEFIITTPTVIEGATDEQTGLSLEPSSDTSTDIILPEVRLKFAQLSNATKHLYNKCMDPQNF